MSKRGKRKGLMREVSRIDGETRWKEERPLGMRMNFIRGKCKCCNNQQKSLPRRNAIKITFKPSTLLALSAITAPERPAPTTNKKSRKVEKKSNFDHKETSSIAQFSQDPQTKDPKKRMKETYNKIVFLLQPVHPSPFLFSNLQTGFSCFFPQPPASSPPAHECSGHLMPVLLGILLVARLPCPQYLTFPLLRILLKAASN